jgi:hypothetical protein
MLPPKRQAVYWLAAVFSVITDKLILWLFNETNSAYNDKSGTLIVISAVISLGVQYAAFQDRRNLTIYYASLGTVLVSWESGLHHQ